MCNCNKGSGAARSSTITQSSANAALFHSVGKSKIKKTKYKVSAPPPSVPGENLFAEDLEGETFAAKCLTFGYVLGLEMAVPEKVLITALENPDYAKRLVMNRGQIHLYDLLNNPPERQQKLSAGTLISKAGKALLQWGLSGFPTVSKEVIKKREDACLACPYLVEPTLVLQKITASSKITLETGHRTGNKSCAKCGCVIKNKIRLETETCPEEVTETKGFNRWGEGVKVGQ
ncbi:MAG: hypothetical protein M3R17_06810 [Bacteroidota bacterium]|nr:hypothetical protein [Bacteroidota bacterium]